MRVYVPASIDLVRLLSDNAAVPGPLDAVAVTPGLREWYATSEADDLEYAAMSRAADLALDAAVAGRRVVLAVEADDADVTVLDDPVGSVALARIDTGVIESFHVDDDGAVDAVLAARGALAAAPEGTTPPEVEDLDDHELAWFARQELGAVLDLLAT